YDAIIVGNFCSPTGMLAVFHMKLFKIPYILFSEGGFAKDGKGFKERLKKKIIKNAELYLSTSIPGDNYFLTYGALKERIRRIPFTSLYEKDILKYVFTKEQKDKIRIELNLPIDKKIIISVGQLINRKAFDILIEASMNISTKNEILIIGSGPEKKSYLDLIEKKHIKNINILGFMNKDELSKYYESSDLFVLPTREDTWGLVIIEAMAKALPVITTTSCVAGVELIEKDVNGRLVEKDDALLLAKNIDELLSNDSLLDKMSINNLEKIKFQTYEKMVEVHLNIFKKYMNRIKK
ncbi:MAG: glycosyltransferase family 4 protein, partial [Bacilli bacterium]|nr:glycosyltransferase family 4 protein [Bacilli bacterium]